MTPPRAPLRRRRRGAGWWRAGWLFLVLASAVRLAPIARAQDTTSPAVPEFHGYVNDYASVIGEARAAQLEAFLDQLHSKTGVQFAVLTMTSCEPEEPSTFKTRVFQKWGIGNKERDDGVLFLVSMQEHALYFETGYGLEGTLPDGWQSRMVRDLAAPRFRAGEPAEGITAAVLAASQRIAAEKGVKLEWNGRELRHAGSGRPPTWILLFLVFGLFFVVIPALATQSRYRRRRGWYYGGWGGGFGGFGGGFGGGGGGGGSSFGGFGGGSSGGGGGGAHW